MAQDDAIRVMPFWEKNLNDLRFVYLETIRLEYQCGLRAWDDTSNQSQRHHPTWEELLQTHMEQFSENSRFYKWHSASDSFSEIFLRLRISLNQEIGPQCYWSCVSHWKPAARKISMEEVLESILAELSELSELSESFKLSELSKN